ERYEAAVLADARAVAVAVGRRAALPDTDERRRVRLHVADKDVALAVGVAGDQVAGLATEGNEAAVGADGGVERAAVPGNALWVDADHLGRVQDAAGGQVAEEDVRHPAGAIGRGDVGPVLVRVVRQVAGAAGERDPVAVGAGERLGAEIIGVAAELRP